MKLLAEFAVDALQMKRLIKPAYSIELLAMPRVNGISIVVQLNLLDNCETLNNFDVIQFADMVRACRAPFTN